jgi:hypothetical protein
MSFVITVYIPGGIVMASDSRQTIGIQRNEETAKNFPPIPIVSSDYVYKTYLLQKAQVGISTFGEAFLGKMATDYHLKKFEEEEVLEIDDVESIAQKLLSFFKASFPLADTSFHIAGYKKEDKISVPYVYHSNIKRAELKRLNYVRDNNQITYGASWGGESDIITEILQPAWIKDSTGELKQFPKPQIIWDIMSLQDAIDFAVYAVKTTIDTMRFQARPKTVGGPIDVLLITPDGTNWIKRKDLQVL